MPKVIDAPAGECLAARHVCVQVCARVRLARMRIFLLHSRAANTDAHVMTAENTHAGSARRTARREAATPYKGDGQEGGIIARMLNEGAEGEHVLRTEDLEARAESEALPEVDGEVIIPFPFSGLITLDITPLLNCYAS
jgi:hypothetical protein